MLPIVQRELQTAARNPKLYRGRLLSWVGIFLLICMIVPMGPRFSKGGQAFQFLTHLALLICLLDGIRKTADSISSERREGTLGLLFLSTLSGWDIILGKLASAAIRSLSTLLVFVPVLAVTLLLGGTTAGEFWRSILVLILALLMSLAVCICLSTLLRDSAISAAFVFFTALSILPFVFSAVASIVSPAAAYFQEAAGWILPLSPFRALKNASDLSYTVDAASFWLGVTYLTCVSLLALALASFVLPRMWQDRPIKARGNQRIAGKLSPRMAAKRRAMLDRNPIQWLMFDARSHSKFRLLLIALVAFVVIGSGAAIYIARNYRIPGFDGLQWVFPTLAMAILVMVASTRVARMTSRNFAEARANGALELMLSTPLRVRDILAGQWLALRADLFPGLIIFAVFGAFVLLSAMISGQGEPTLLAVKLLLESLLGLATTAAVGIWMGLTSKSAGRAFFKTVVIGLIAPHVVCTPTLVNQLVLLLLALDKVKVHFRRFVAEQYLANRTFLSTIGMAPPNTPPVLRR